MKGYYHINLFPVWKFLMQSGYKEIAPMDTNALREIVKKVRNGEVLPFDSCISDALKIIIKEEEEKAKTNFKLMEMNGKASPVWKQ